MLKNLHFALKLTIVIPSIYNYNTKHEKIIQHVLDI